MRSPARPAPVPPAPTPDPVRGAEAPRSRPTPPQNRRRLGRSAAFAASAAPSQGRATLGSAAALAVVVAALSIAAAPAGAAESPLPGIDAVALNPAASRGSATPEELRVGEGRAAFLTWGAKRLTVHAVEGGAVRRVTTLPGRRSEAAQVESVGTDAAGRPVAILRRALRGGSADRRALVRLDTGRTTELRLGSPAGTRVLGVAIDHGKLRIARGAARETRRTRATLLTGRLSGSTVTNRRVLHVFPAGFRPQRIVAQKGRVALETIRGGGTIWAGGPDVGWRAVFRGASDGYRIPQALGFTSDASAVVVYERQERNEDGEIVPVDGVRLQLQPVAGGAARTVDVGPLSAVAYEAGGWDETSDRLLLRAGPGAKQDSRLPTVLGYAGPFASR